MKVQDLLMNVYNSNFNWLEELEVKHYIPIMDKKMFIMDVIAACTDELDGCVTVDRFKMNIYFDMKMLDLYTNLEIAHSFSEMIDEYDLLCENNTMYNLINLFSHEYDIMRKLLDDMIKELISQNSIDMQVVKIANKLTNILDIVNNQIGDVDLKSMLPEGTNINELANVIGLLK